jgi:nucleoside-diphosphate-sugar epimerase
MWFAEALAAREHSVVAVGRREQVAYSGLRAERLARVGSRCQTLWNAPFGSPRFLEIVAENGPFDVLCQHGAETAGYRNQDFDAVAATEANARALPAVLDALKTAGCRRIVLTGSIFEAGEGAGTEPLHAFSAYGLSKTLTAQIFAFYAEKVELAFAKFVIPNPFGPFEEPRFTDYLIRSWRDGKSALVSTPRYVRDNIHVSLLANVYCGFVEALPQTGFHKINPSGYTESQSSFAARFASEIGARLNLETPLEEARQRIFEEPPIRINTDVAYHIEHDWNEQGAWDQLADYYATRYSIERR